jgi:hypothetical protein
VSRKHTVDAGERWLWEAIAREQEQETLYEAMMKLRRPPAALTEPECAALLKRIKAAKKKLPRGRPSGPDAVGIAQYCTLREAFGMPTKVAVGETMRLFGTSRAAVYEARRKLLSK